MRIRNPFVSIREKPKNARTYSRKRFIRVKVECGQRGINYSADGKPDNFYADNIRLVARHSARVR